MQHVGRHDHERRLLLVGPCRHIRRQPSRWPIHHDNRSLKRQPCCDFGIHHGCSWASSDRCVTMARQAAGRMGVCYLTLGLSWIRATELYWVSVYTLFERVIREELYYQLAASTSKSTSTLPSTTSIQTIATSLPSFPSHFVGKKKRTLASTCRNVLKPAQASTCQRRRPPHSRESPTRPAKLAKVASRTTPRV